MRRLTLPLPLLALALLLAQVPLAQPLYFSAMLRLDALSGLMLLALLLGLTAAWAGSTTSLPRTLGIAAALAIAYLALWLPLMMAGYAAAALIAGWRRAALRTVLPALVLAIALGWLGLRADAWSFDAPAAAAALDRYSFGLLLLAALLGLELLPPVVFEPRDQAWGLLLRPGWIYPLARLYELGTWNTGWVLATALIGGALALWAGWTAPWGEEQRRMQRVEASLLGGALASLGLASEAGLAGALMGLLAAVLATAAIGSGRRHPLLWLAAGPVPLSLPFVALWLQVSAAVAGGVVLLAAALWLSAIGWSVATLRTLSSGPRQRPGWMLSSLALLSMAAGIASPLLLDLFIGPVLLQLGAGITPYGRPVSWPWLGLEVRNAGGAVVTAWLSMAIVGLLLLLTAIAYLLLRLLDPRRKAAPDAEGHQTPPALWSLVRRSVPWLPSRGAEHDDR